VREDRSLSEEIATVASAIRKGFLLEAVEQETGALR
jgi:hypothetical protein